ncbi:MAG TPA: hypothetical protein DGO89_07105 [Microcoleaceae bacterium UBA9251]|nr:hypothetical protein [Microcoleaceae cyanobacterium UBA9251]
MKPPCPRTCFLSPEIPPTPRLSGGWEGERDFDTNERVSLDASLRPKFNQAPLARPSTAEAFGSPVQWMDKIKLLPLHSIRS